MQKRFTLFAVLGILASLIVLSVAGIIAQDVGTAESATTAVSSGLLSNGGFETDANSDNVPDGFKVMRQDAKLSTDAKSGSKSIMFEDNTTNAKSPYIESEEFIAIDTSKTYELSGYAKSSSGQQTSYLGLVFFGADKKPVYFYNATNDIASYYNYPPMNNKKPPVSWTLYQGNITGESRELTQSKFPVGTKFAKVRAFGVYRTNVTGVYSTPGKVWMDDIQFVEVLGGSGGGSGGSKTYSAGELVSINSSMSALVKVNGTDHTVSLVTTSSSSAATIKVDGTNRDVTEKNNYTFTGGASGDIVVEIRDVVHPAYAGDTRRVDLVVSQKNVAIAVRDACGDLSDKVKLAINRLRSGNMLISQEGEYALVGQYIVLGAGANKVIEVQDISIDNAIRGTVTFSEMVTGQVVEVLVYNTSQGYVKPGISLFGGNLINITASADGKKVSITWSPDNVIDTYNCLVPAPSTCSDLVNRVANPKDYERSGTKYRLLGNGSWSGEYSEEIGKYTAHYASWSVQPAYSTDSWMYSSIQVWKFENSSFDAKEVLENWVSGSSCQLRSVDDGFGKIKQVYICSWDGTDIQNQNDYKSRGVYWYYDNVIVSAYFSEGQWMTDAELATLFAKKTDEILSNMVNNGYKWSSSDLNDIDYSFRQEIAETLEECSSEIPQPVDNDGNPCTQQWYCKTEPAICPEYGYQTRICQESGCNTQEVKEEKLYCSPGICSGCYVPRWFGSKTDNVCVPYGTRLESNTAEEIKLEERVFVDSTHLEFNLTVIDQEKAYLYFDDEDGSIFDQILYIGGTYELYEGKNDLIRFRVDKIVPGTNGKSGYIMITVLDSFNAYCDIDGDVKPQKEKQYNGEWASCQNNYECSSNFCSAGECIEVQDMINEASALKTFFVKVACRLTNPFDNAGYSRCLAENLGGREIPTMSPPVDLTAQSSSTKDLVLAN